MDSPKSIKLTDDKTGLVIEWQDGHKGSYPFSLLRQSCPCAMCKGEKMPLAPEPLALPSLPNLPPAAFEVKDLFKVGNYAIGFTWGDGHNTGIYTFDYLRRICPCPECEKNEKINATVPDGMTKRGV